MTQPSPLYRLIEIGLGEPLAEFVGARRQPTKSWREIAEEIHERTGESVTAEGLRRWFAEQSTEAPASAA